MNVEGGELLPHLANCVLLTLPGELLLALHILQTALELLLHLAHLLLQGLS